MENRSSQTLIDAALEESCTSVYQDAMREIGNLDDAIKRYRVVKDTASYDAPITATGKNGQKWEVKKHPLYPDSAIFTKKDQSGKLQYEIRVDRRNDTNTFTCHGNSTDRKAGKVGTDNTAVVKILGKNSYDHIKVDDLIDRFVSLANAAKLLEPTNARLHRELDNYQKFMVGEIQKKCDFYDLNHLARTGGGDYEVKHKTYKKLLEGAVWELCQFVNKARGDAAEIDINSIARELQKREVTMLNDNGRPLIIKSKEINSKIVVSLQMPLGEKTIVSGDRSGDKAVKLSNHVRDATAVVGVSGRLQIAYSVDGHSSYSPIDVKDDGRRQEIANEAAIEKARQLILDQFGGDIGKLKAAIAAGVTIELPIAAMTMLTPTKLAKLEKGARGKESENSQFTETGHALAYLERQKSIDIPGVGPVPVNVDVMAFNIPVNVKGTKQKLLRSSRQEEMNKRGIAKFIDKMRAYDFANKIDWDKLQVDSTSTIAGLEGMKVFFNDIFSSSHDELKKKLTPDAMKRAVGTLERFLDDNNKIPPDVREKLIGRLYMLKTLDYFYNEEYLKPGHAYQFHVNLLHAAKRMGCLNEAFCKSAEDRTGWLRINLMANEIFTEIYGRPPNLDSKKDVDKFTPLVKQCYELSASVENTKYNSEARGLQSGEGFIAKSHATTAKACFHDFKKSLKNTVAAALGLKKSQSTSELSRSSSSEVRVKPSTTSKSDPVVSKTKVIAPLAAKVVTETDRRAALRKSQASAESRASHGSIDPRNPPKYVPPAPAKEQVDSQKETEAEVVRSKSNRFT